MIRPSLLATALLSLASLVVVGPLGCAAPTSDDSEGSVVDGQDELTAAATQFVGSYYAPSVAFGGLARLKLEANGKFSAQLDGAGKILCVMSPCLLSSSGTWSASKSGGGYRLNIHPTGEAARLYSATKTAGTLKLTRSGRTETLTALGKSQCLDSRDCTAIDECAPKVCAMLCAESSPFCCGPSTCQAKPTEPAKKFCGGIAGIACAANEDCVDDPTDGCDPTKGGADCGGICKPKAAPIVCGTTTCGAGLVCCNPVMNICTKPGEFCIQ